MKTPLQLAVQKLLDQKMSLTPFVTDQGKMIYCVGGYNLTAAEVLDLDSRGKLNLAGIEELAEEYRTIHFQSLCPECKASKPVTLNLHWLTEELRKGAEISVLSICGHSWRLADHEKRNLKARVSDGVIPSHSLERRHTTRI